MTARRRVNRAFQPTHPLRGATMLRPVPAPALRISTHAPLAGCDGGRRVLRPLRPPISTHAPLAGCDTSGLSPTFWRANFNPRTPCGVRRTPGVRQGVPGDDFNPRTPCGVRRSMAGYLAQSSKFQPTHPLRGATGQHLDQRPRGLFQPTHPFRGATNKR